MLLHVPMCHVYSAIKSIWVYLDGNVSLFGSLCLHAFAGFILIIISDPLLCGDKDKC